VDGRLTGFVGVSDLDAVQGFYGGVLGLDLVDERPFALVADELARAARRSRGSSTRTATTSRWPSSRAEDGESP